MINNMAGKNVALIVTFLVLCVLPAQYVDTLSPLTIIKDLIQNNIAGQPLIHQTFEFDFDPEAGKNSRALYYETNGYRGEKFVERIGVGVDGRQEERRLQQAIRDQGRLNGEHYINFP